MNEKPHRLRSYEKHGFFKFISKICSDSPRALLMVIAKENLTGNYKICIRMAYLIFVGIIGIVAQYIFKY